MLNRRRHPNAFRGASTPNASIWGRTRRHPILVGGILALLSMVVLLNVYSVGVAHEETLFQKNRKVDTFARHASAEKKLRTVENNGGETAMVDRRVEDHDDVLDVPVKAALGGDTTVVSPLSSGMISNLDSPTPQRQLLDTVDPNPIETQDPDQKKNSRAYFIKRGNQFYVTSRDALDLHERLPAETYSIGINPMTGEYFLQSIDSFDIHGKIYGDTKRQASRILQTFMDRHGSTGVLLSGEKVNRYIFQCCTFFDLHHDTDAKTKLHTRILYL